VLSALAKPLRGAAWDTTEENIQARIRGVLLIGAVEQERLDRAHDR